MEKIPKFSVCWWWRPTPIYNVRIKLLDIPHFVAIYLNVNGWDVERAVGGIDNGD